VFQALLSALNLICVIHSVWAFYVPLFGSLILLGLLYWKRHSSPMNFVLLGSFTAAEALTLGVAVAFYDNTIVLQALLITVGVFLGLTLFTFQSKVCHSIV
jgi:FtsH-binding integral membrane protein